jgi:succinate dehydrogenase/fumarate reductase flavoprotein subunit
MDAPQLKSVLADKVEQAGTQIIDRTMAIALLTDDQGVCGAIALHVRTGELLVCLAKAVIITNGGCARFGLPNSGYLFGTVDFPGNTGDGYAMGYRAGAQVTGLEYTVSASIVKDLNTPLLVPAQSMGAIIVNSRGEEIEGTKNRAHTSTDMWENNRANAPLFVRTRHLPDEKIRQIESVLFSTERPVQKRFYEGRGINMREQDVELGPTEHYLCGGHGMAGLAINERAETSLPGLYAAGDAAGVAFQYLTGAFVLGEVAAEAASERVSAAHSPVLGESQVAQVERQIAEATRPKQGPQVSLDELEYKVRRIVNDYIVSPKNEWKLRNAIQWMHKFREELPALIQIGDPHDLARYFEVSYIIDSAELSATAALVRTESRWGPRHRRTDYPDRDDEKWLRQILLQPAPDGSIEVTFRPTR